jgi:hypothetical protein
MYKQIFIYLFRVLLLTGSSPVSEEPRFSPYRCGSE